MIVVTGATGNVGRVLVPLLANSGEDVTAVARGPEPGGLQAGVRYARADLGSGAGMAPVLDGAAALFLLVGRALAGSDANPEELVDAATGAGVKRIVLLSSQINATRPAATSHARLRDFEAAVREGAANSTILRPSGFASNSLAWAESVRAERTVHAPFGDVALPVVDPADIAGVAAATLREDGHADRTYELTGPRAISPRGQAAAIATALGEHVAFVELTRERAHTNLARFMPEAVADGTLDILGHPLPAERAISPAIPNILHRPAAPFDAWVTRNLPAFR